MNNIGIKIYGFCDGYFGSDDYDDKIIIYETPISIFCKYVNEDVYVATNFRFPEEKQRLINKWSVKNG